jgi:ABC-type lipopolysaccharide export system ATPase subunit
MGPLTAEYSVREGEILGLIGPNGPPGVVFPVSAAILEADRAVAQRPAFRRAGDDADMSRCHDDVS